MWPQSHLGPSVALVMAQKYPLKGFVDMSFFDNGITIPKNLQKHDHEFSPPAPITEAVKGLSMKGVDRGFGLSSSVKIFNEGLNGEILIVSGYGAVYFKEQTPTGFNLVEGHQLNGTLISLRAPHPPSNIEDFYKYLEG